MADFNPYLYDSIEYYEFEVQQAELTLELVTTAALAHANAAAEENTKRFVSAFVELSKTVLRAESSVKYAKRNLESAKEKAAKKAEGEGANG